MTNGLVTIRFDRNGDAYSLAKGTRELLSSGGKIYLSYNTESYRRPKPDSLKVLRAGSNATEIVYLSSEYEFDVELHYIMLRGVSGVYCYVVMKNSRGGALTLVQLNLTMRVDYNIFNYAYTRERQGPMISPAQLRAAVQIQDATYMLKDGTVYTKYDWAAYEAEENVHGLCGNNYGVWVISASKEYANGGPLKQELMVHGTDTTPVILELLQGTHFGAGAAVVPAGWQKLYGPFLMYVNTGTNEGMIADALSEAGREEAQWPYQWMDHPLYPLERATVTGRFNIAHGNPAAGMTVILGKADGETYLQGKDYMFWARTDENGRFSIPRVRPGGYTLYAYATDGALTDEFRKDDITVGGNPITDLGDLDWQPPAHAHLLWSIGKADRMSGEFKFGGLARQYGLWEKVPADLTFNIGGSLESEDWYYAQTKTGIWDIVFNLDRAYPGEGVLTIAVAGVARGPKLDVIVNGQTVESFEFDNDPTIYRSALRGGRYRLRTVRFPASFLKTGGNKISLKLKGVGDKGGIMYDMLKLEAD
ncbi:MAG: hypothetical protein HZB21_04220 [Deltaproteobacteria bacterium]|nr:hypothetical protein [Deltaproteobacteria bacterium]